MQGPGEVGDGKKAAAPRVQRTHHPRTVLLVPQTREHPLRNTFEKIVVLWRCVPEEYALRFALAPGHELVGLHDISHVSARAPHARARHAVQGIYDSVGVGAHKVALSAASHAARFVRWGLSLKKAMAGLTSTTTTGLHSLKN